VLAPARAACIAALLLLGALGCRCEGARSLARRASEKLPGGATSVSYKPFPSFELPAANLGPDGRPDFYAGRALAGQPWVQAPSITDARDGLGPLYNARTCFACHVKGGHGLAPESDGPLSIATLVRLSVPGSDPIQGVVPEPTYGSQLQEQSIELGHQLRKVSDAAAALPSTIPREGGARVEWVEEPFCYPDGSTVRLRRPKVELVDLGYGDLAPDAMLGLRHAPAIHGLGLLDAIEQADIDQLADPDDRNADGISGRVNRVWDPELEETRPGRFGLKANQATLKAQVAAALHGDMGITSSLFSALPCTEAQPGCRRAPHGAPDMGPEVADPLLDLIVDFNRSIGVPMRRKEDDPMVLRGRELFYEIGCQSCHTPSFVTGVDPRYPHLSSQEIWPYTDLLLHDMGEGLADGRTDFLASGSEWRTPPLWGVGLARAVDADVGLLHDGRARNVEEAVLWHGGEAQGAKERFVELPEESRSALLAFVRSL